ncbi:MAG: MltA domain-containing protein [Sedimentisphaerales bacterium]|nr:MltA domain-containing protein [Sedimentisphaerales bacterium]
MKNRMLPFVLLFMVVICGCQSRMREEIKTDYDRPLPQGMYALRKITDPHGIPDFTLACLDLTDLRSSIANSLNYLQKPSSRQFFPCGQITHNQTVASLQAFAELLDSGLTGAQLNQAIRQKFDVYISVGCDDRGTVLFTGYYTPVFDASFTRSRRFRYPLYKTPNDLVKGKNGEILGQRGSDGQIRPYPSRFVIEDSGMLKGKELVWLSDPFEAYIAHVQGSAKLRLPDGKLITVGYDANNGYEYRSVAQELIRDGRISGENISLATMIDYFKTHPEQVSMYVNRNPRFVFFRQEEGPPLGSLNEPVTAMRSIATDKSIFPRAALTFISTSLPKNEGGRIVNRIYSGFALDQDTGGAIRAPGRCDVYMGQGDIAGKLAGQTRQEGKLYYLFLKPAQR